jgi:hypothetical protein
LLHVGLPFAQQLLLRFVEGEISPPEPGAMVRFQVGISEQPLAFPGIEVFLIDLDAIILVSSRRTLENSSIDSALINANSYYVSMGPTQVLSFLKGCSLQSTSGTEELKK